MWQKLQKKNFQLKRRADCEQNFHCENYLNPDITTTAADVFYTGKIADL